MCSVFVEQESRKKHRLSCIIFFCFSIGYGWQLVFLSHSYIGAQKFMREYTHLVQHSIAIAKIRIIEIIIFLINSTSGEAI